MTTHYEKFLKNGKEIFDTYCSSDDRAIHPFMLPRAPQLKYIDVYPVQDQPGCSFKDDRQQQLNYEAEVLVYRALENVPGHFTVVHNFEFTHYQYHLGDTSHVKRDCVSCKKRAANREGECDFIVIGQNYFVIIEVKNMKHLDKTLDPESNLINKQALEKTFKKSSLKQRRKVTELIKRINKRSTVLQFTAYPNFRCKFKDEFNLNIEQRSTIIFGEDIENFNTWWKDNVEDLILNLPLVEELQIKHEEVRNFLLAVWCTDNKGVCDIAKCSLGRCISEIDKKLRSGRFTFRQNNPEVVSTPPSMRNILAIENLTKQQNDLINSTEKLLWINGPAGTGKTVVLLAKILQLALASEENKIVILNSTGAADSTNYHKEALQKAGIKHELIFLDDFQTPIDRIRREISTSLLDCQVVIVVIKWIYRLGVPATDMFTSLQGVNLFIDDIQCVLSWISEVTYFGFITILLKLSESNHIWVACDAMQCPHHKSCLSESYSNLAKSIKETLTSNQQVNLSKILRNSFDLSIVLEMIRGRIIQKELRGKSTNLDIIFPLQTPGHYIHGPKTVMHFVEHFDHDLILTVFKKELQNVLCEQNYIDKKDIGLIYTTGHNDSISLVKDIEKDISHHSLHGFRTCSSEWPIVIVLHALKDHLIKKLWKYFSPLFPVAMRHDPEEDKLSDLETLYLAISRARVKCSVIMFPMNINGLTFDNEDFNSTKDLLNSLNNNGLVEINKYP